MDTIISDLRTASDAETLTLKGVIRVVYTIVLGICVQLARFRNGMIAPSEARARPAPCTTSKSVCCGVVEKNERKCSTNT